MRHSERPPPPPPSQRCETTCTIAARALAASSNWVGRARRHRITRPIEDCSLHLWLVNRGAQAVAVIWVWRADPLGALVVQLELATRTRANHADAAHTKSDVCLGEMQTEKVLGTGGVPPSPLSNLRILSHVDVQHGTCLAPREAIVDASPLVGVGDAHAAHARQCHFGERQRRKEARIRTRGPHVRVFNVR